MDQSVCLLEGPTGLILAEFPFVKISSKNRKMVEVQGRCVLELFGELLIFFLQSEIHSNQNSDRLTILFVLMVWYITRMFPIFI